MRGVFSIANDINLFLLIIPHMSLHCKLVPVLYREHEYGLSLSHEKLYRTALSLLTGISDDLPIQNE